MRWPALLVLIGLGLATRPSLAEGGAQITFGVVGTGSLRLRVGHERAGRACDPDWYPHFYEGVVPAGQKLTLWSPTASICFQHTWGAFRDIGWSPSARATAHGGRLDLELSTEDPARDRLLLP